MDFFAAVPPARGTPLADLVPAAICGAIGMLLVLAIAVGHRRGVFRPLAWLSERAERATGQPGFVVIPTSLASASLLVAAFGYYWDVSWHIDRGRDPGPFANPAHWFIIAGLAGIAIAGVFAIVLGDERATRSSLPVRPGWNVPVGGVLLALCGVVALAGFPLDDVWHRIFGQDVTAWGPTHIQMIAGASLATLALWVLSVEGDRVTRAGAPASSSPHPRPAATWMRRLNDLTLGGAFLIGLSTLQVEFDFGVPQFRQVNHPILVMLAAGIGLVAVRIRGTKGSALSAAAFFVVLRGALALAIAGPLGRSTLHFPLYVVEALAVEVVALMVSSRRPIRFGLATGAAVAAVGLPFEWWWSHVAMPLPWHAALIPEGAIAGAVAALAGATIGAFIGHALDPAAEPSAAAEPSPHANALASPRSPLAVAAGLACIAAVACIGWSLPTTTTPVRAALAVEPAAAPGHSGERWGTVALTLDPPGAADHARWFHVLAWQGRRQGSGGLVIAPLRRTGAGRYTTSSPVPLDGTWKTLVRLQTARAMEVVPLRLPLDAAIPAPAVTTGAHAVREFERDKRVLQREAIGGSIGLQRGAYALLGVIGVLWIASIAWGLRRLERGPAPRRFTRPARPTVRAPMATGPV